MGLALARGLDIATAKAGQPEVEGVATAREVRQGAVTGVEMPITEQTYRPCIRRADPRAAVHKLLSS